MRLVKIAALLSGVYFSIVAPLSYAQDMSAQLAVCGACHGPDGNSSMAGSPSLAGQPKIFLENNLIQWDLLRQSLLACRYKGVQLDLLSDLSLVGKELNLFQLHYIGELHYYFLGVLAELGTLPSPRLWRII
jgi:hypothetical protein